MREPWVDSNLLRDVVDKFYDTVILDSERNKRLAKCIDETEIREMQARYKSLSGATKTPSQSSLPTHPQPAADQLLSSSPLVPWDQPCLCF